jgi:hypothetical protein
MNPKLHLLAAAIVLPIVCSTASAQFCGNGVFLGQLSTNPFLVDSTANKFGAFGSPYCLARSRESRHEVAVLRTGYRAAAPPPGSATSIINPYSAFGSPYSAVSVSNPYATSAPKIIAADGQYLGRLSANPYDPDSVSNPYGQYGSPYSPTSINNPYSQYGSRYSPMSPNNPYATEAPVLCGDDD